jgi:hypothetical protein
MDELQKQRLMYLVERRYERRRVKPRRSYRAVVLVMGALLAGVALAQCV